MLSDLLRYRLADQRRRRGRVVDLVVDLAAGDYPPVTRLIYRMPGSAQRDLDWSAVQVADWPRRRLVVQDLETGRAAPPEALTRSVLLKRDVRDALVIDVAERTVARANDLWLREEDGRLILRAADLSPWAVLRRLGRGLLGRGGERRLLDWRDVEFLRGNPQAARAGQDYHRRVARLRPREIARLLDALPYLHAAELLTLIPADLAADTLEAMAPRRQVQVFEELDPDLAVRLLALVAPDAAVDLLGRIDANLARRYLEALPDESREPLMDLLRYPADTAGGLMTNDVVVAPADCPVRDVRQLLKRQLRGSDFAYYVYVVDNLEDRHLEGVSNLRDVLLADDSQPLREVMRGDIVAVDPLEPADAAARRFADSDLAALPVVGQDRHLLGVITVDRAMREIAPPEWGELAPRIFS